MSFLVVWVSELWVGLPLPANPLMCKWLTHAKTLETKSCPRLNFTDQQPHCQVTEWSVIDLLIWLELIALRWTVWKPSPWQKKKKMLDKSIRFIFVFLWQDGSHTCVHTHWFNWCYKATHTLTNTAIISKASAQFPLCISPSLIPLFFPLFVLISLSIHPFFLAISGVQSTHFSSPRVLS